MSRYRPTPTPCISTVKPGTQLYHWEAWGGCGGPSRRGTVVAVFPGAGRTRPRWPGEIKLPLVHSVRLPANSRTTRAPFAFSRDSARVHTVLYCTGTCASSLARSARATPCRAPQGGASHGHGLRVRGPALMQRVHCVQARGCWMLCSRAAPPIARDDWRRTSCLSG